MHKKKRAPFFPAQWKRCICEDTIIIRCFCAGDGNFILRDDTQALKNVEHLVIAEDEAGCPKAFMGIEDGSLEMLFVAPEERGKGL